VRFWDTSALIPLILFEPGTARVIRWLRRDPDVTVWTLTRVELLSALARRRRAEPPSAPRIVQAKRDILEFWARWFEITAVERVRQLAERVVERPDHGGRAGGFACPGAGLTYPILWIDSSPARR
jgi:uncharacterized protein with PIN domain